MQPGGDVTASESVIFHPEGAFDIVNGPLSGARPAGATGIGALDVMAGAVATEFLDLATVDAAQIHFSRGPAFLGAPGELTSGPPASKLPGPVITSYLQFADDTGKVRDVPLHSQPAAAPLFVVAQGAQRDLPRRREPLGLTGLPPADFSLGGLSWPRCRRGPGHRSHALVASAPRAIAGQGAGRAGCHDKHGGRHAAGRAG
jgi:hypothetical protein